MRLEQALRDGLSNIKSGQLSKEEQVKTSVILPILQALGWNNANQSEIVAELSVELGDGKGSVDYALHRTSPNNQPLVFIEAKRPGGVDSLGEKQLFQYGKSKSVPLLILTDGNVWNFYLDMGNGTADQLRFYKAVLEQEEKLGEYAEKLKLFLERDRVLSDEAIQEALAQRRSDRDRTLANKAIRSCWQELLGEPNQSFVDLLADLVQTKIGHRPDLEDVKDFLKRQSSFSGLANPVSSASPPKPQSASPLPPPSARGVTGKSRRSKIVGFALDGVETRTGAASRTLAEVLKEFQRRDQTQDQRFMRRLYEEGIGRTRRLVAQNRDDLYDSSHLTVISVDLGNGWWLGTHVSQAAAIKHIELACKIADVSYGTRLTLIYRD